MKLHEKWTRVNALKIINILTKLNLCSCSEIAKWICIKELLEEAINDTPKGFYKDKWFEFGAHILNRFNLLDHGTGIGASWITKDGKLLLEFIKDFKLDEDDNNNFKLPDWATELRWDENENDKDSYSRWVKSCNHQESNYIISN